MPVSSRTDRDQLYGAAAMLVVCAAALLGAAVYKNGGEQVLDRWEKERLAQKAQENVAAGRRLLEKRKVEIEAGLARLASALTILREQGGAAPTGEVAREVFARRADALRLTTDQRPDERVLVLNSGGSTVGFRGGRGHVALWVELESLQELSTALGRPPAPFDASVPFLVVGGRFQRPRLDFGRDLQMLRGAFVDDASPLLQRPKTLARMIEMVKSPRFLVVTTAKESTEPTTSGATFTPGSITESAAVVDLESRTIAGRTRIHVTNPDEKVSGYGPSPSRAATTTLYSRLSEAAEEAIRDAVVEILDRTP